MVLKYLRNFLKYIIIVISMSHAVKNIIIYFKCVRNNNY